MQKIKMQRHRIASFSKGALVVGAALICAGAVLQVYLPKVISVAILPRLASAVGVTSIQAQVIQIGLTGATLADVVIGGPEDRAVEVASLRLEYHLWGLLHQKLQRVIVSGAHLYCVKDQRGWRLRGMASGSRLNTSKGDGYAKGDFTSAVMKHLSLRSSTVIFNWNGQSMRLPIEADIDLPQSAEKALEGHARLYLRGEAVWVRVRQVSAIMPMQIVWCAPGLNLLRFSDWIQKIPDFELRASARIDGQADIVLFPFKVTKFSLTCELNHLDGRFKQVPFSNASTANQQAMPLLIRIFQQSDNRWQLQGSSFTLGTPFSVTVDSLSLEIERQPLKVQASGIAQLTAAGKSSFVRLPSMHLQHPLTVQAQLSGTYADSGEWRFKVLGQPSDSQLPWRVGWGSAGQLTVSFPVIEFQGQGKERQGEIYFNVAATVKADSDSQHMGISPLSLNGRISLKADRLISLPSADIDFTAGNLYYQTPAGRLTIPGLSLKGVFKYQPFINNAVFTGVLKLKRASFSGKRNAGAFRGLSMELPLQYPGKSEAGWFVIKRISWDQHDIGSIKGRIHQSYQRLKIKGSYKNRQLPQLSADIIGDVGLTDAGLFEADFKIDTGTFSLAADTGLGAWHKALAGMTAKGEMASTAQLHYGPSGITGAIDAALTKGTLQWEKDRARIEGIDVAVSLTDLFSMRSLPQQQLRFERARLGNLEVTDGVFEFQIESPSSIFIEKGGFKWCTGRVESPATRIRPGREDYQLVLHCDRIHLACVLKQFGAGIAEGEGSLNGRIPLSYVDGALSFDDGYLYSTPGSGGTLRVKGMEMLTAGVPPDTPQFAQIELAREALKDYEYKWAKLNLTSERQTLLLQLQLDGKPKNPLPFVYQKDIGGFAKIKAGSKGSHFQGIRLDVNFKLPLNELLRYGKHLPKAF